MRGAEPTPRTQPRLTVPLAQPWPHGHLPLPCQNHGRDVKEVEEGVDAEIARNGVIGSLTGAVVRLAGSWIKFFRGKQSKPVKRRDARDLIRTESRSNRPSFLPCPSSLRVLSVGHHC